MWEQQRPTSLAGLKGQQLCSVAHCMRRSTDQLPEDETQRESHISRDSCSSTKKVRVKVTVERKKPCNFSFQRLLVF